MNKNLSYLVRRAREGKYKFYCSKRCSNAAHSENMRGSGNPNFEGEFHGKPFSELPIEDRKLIGEKISKTMKEKGISKGSRNPKWAGGYKEVRCRMCDKAYRVRPYISRRIDAGERQALCSSACAGAYVSMYGKRSFTSIELKMHEELTRRGVNFIPQYVVNQKFALDFYLPDHNIAVECDGDYWHKLPKVVKRDKSKNAYLAACGMRVFRFWEHRINADVASCVDEIVSAIACEKSIS